MSDARFRSPSDIAAPPGAERWRTLYNWYHVFGETPSAEDDGRFWFQDGLHHPAVMRPYDEIQCECWWQALGAFNTRIFAMPPAFGVDQRILNGYLYVTPVPAPADQIEARLAHYKERASHYYENWDAIYEEWKTKVLACLARIKALRFAPLPDLEDAAVVTEHRGISSGCRMLRDYDELVHTMYETYQYHFELLNIGYAAYLTFFQFMKGAFPDIPEQAIAKMVGGLRVDLYRPDDELKRLAKEAVRLGVDGSILSSKLATEVFARLKDSAAGRDWLADWERTSDPWFVINTDAGHPGGYSDGKTWKDEPSIPLAAVRDYVTRLRAGETIDRPTADVLRRRDETTAGYRQLLVDDDRATFDELVGLARKVFAFIEEHVLYIEHWMWATFWSKSHELADALVAMGALDAHDDFFMLRRFEVMELLYEVNAAWSVGAAPSRSARHYRPIVAERKAIYAELQKVPAVPALGVPPTEITEPFTLMLWGITTATVSAWLEQQRGEGGGAARVLRGLAGSPGVVEGKARVVRVVDDLARVEDGDILVCPATSPAWSPAFARIGATVSDVGGIMSHTAIVCREYGIPAVVGTGNACASIQDGQRLRVDGDNGVVTVLD